MSAESKVRYDIPIPEIDRRPKGPQRKFPLDTMGVGGVLLLPNRTSKAVSAYVSRIARNLPGKFSARQCWMRPRDTPDGVEWDRCAPEDDGAVKGVAVCRIE